ncbi:hypothetical protein P4H83_07835 [Paenibacillus favisporus]|uniref:hypothetical protein n=1 Tax=Paenibacillus favisporus TaxID=221028 RepID=UPI002DBEBB9B|nr:hypothetical protein [Paenibacillus favisporus]MEC0174782.1 hypothetical protein [Paenibacillus favisporus]
MAVVRRSALESFLQSLLPPNILESISMVDIRGQRRPLRFSGSAFDLSAASCIRLAKAITASTQSEDSREKPALRKAIETFALLLQGRSARLHSFKQQKNSLKKTEAQFAVFLWEVPQPFAFD